MDPFRPPFLTWIFLDSPLETINRTVVKRSYPEKSMTSARSSGCLFSGAPSKWLSAWEVYVTSPRRSLRPFQEKPCPCAGGPREANLLDTASPLRSNKPLHRQRFQRRRTKGESVLVSVKESVLSHLTISHATPRNQEQLTWVDNHSVKWRETDSPLTGIAAACMHAVTDHREEYMTSGQVEINFGNHGSPSEMLKTLGNIHHASFQDGEGLTWE